MHYGTQSTAPLGPASCPGCDPQPAGHPGHGGLVCCPCLHRASGGAQVPARPPCFLLLGGQVPLVPGNQQSGPRCQSRGPGPHGICWAVGAMILGPRLNCDICSCPGGCVFSDALYLFKKMDISANPYLACFWGRNRALGEGWFCPVEAPQFQTSPQILSLLCSELGCPPGGQPGGDLPVPLWALPGRLRGSCTPSEM